MTKHKLDAHQCPTEGVVNFSNCASKSIQLGACFAALLELTLQPAEDMVKRQTAFPRGSHTATHPAHACYALLGHLGAALGAVEVEGAGATAVGVTRSGVHRGG